MSLPKDNAQKDCPICLEPVSFAEFRHNCGSKFHPECMKTWILTHEYHPLCPQCRLPVPIYACVLNHVFTNITKEIFKPKITQREAELLVNQLMDVRDYNVSIDKELLEWDFASKEFRVTIHVARKRCSSNRICPNDVVELSHDAFEAYRQGQGYTLSDKKKYGFSLDCKRLGHHCSAWIIYKSRACSVLQLSVPCSLGRMVGRGWGEVRFLVFTKEKTFCPPRSMTTWESQAKIPDPSPVSFPFIESCVKSLQNIDRSTSEGDSILYHITDGMFSYPIKILVTEDEIKAEYDAEWKSW